ncbi:MAG: type II/IV secretion system ATPase subunit [Candidatus Aenigmarchaeota archaeon]|nr:type II/IV secretion system ATPase subunit [Candidatus Aenigmarchaeota archaeon]
MGFIEKIKRFEGALKKKPLEKETLNFRISVPKELIVFPPIKDIKNFSFQYTLLEPFAHVHIKWSNTEKSLVYRVIEPTLSNKEKKVYDRITESLSEIIDVELSSIKGTGKAFEYIEGKVKKILDEIEISLDNTSYNKIMYYIYRDFIGLNEIEPLMHDPYIEDISCDGLNIPLYVIHKKLGSIETNIVFRDEEKLKNFIIKLAERCGRYISYAEPLLDGALPDGSRVQATLSSDVTTKGPTFSIRKFTSEPLSPIDLINLGTASPAIMAYLWFCVEMGTSIMICGGTATGKTTMLNAISLFIPQEWKIVSIEDTRELQLPHENWIPSVARVGFGTPMGEGEKYGEVTMFDLLKASFRQNPDYVIVGEVRGVEASVMFQGMASGHPSIGTMHAAGVSTVIKRLQTPPIELSPSLVETLDLVVTMVHARERGKSARRVKSIEEIEAVEPTGVARTSTVFRWIPSTDTFEPGEGTYTLNKISHVKGIPLRDIKREINIRERIIDYMIKNKITHWKEVSKLVSEYHKNSKEVLKELKIKV